jgi:hypothetical protein
MEPPDANNSSCCCDFRPTNTSLRNPPIHYHVHKSYLIQSSEMISCQRMFQKYSTLNCPYFFKTVSSKLAQAATLPTCRGKYQCRISAGTLTILPVIFRGFPQPLQPNAEILPQKLAVDDFLSHPSSLMALQPISGLGLLLRGSVILHL